MINKILSTLSILIYVAYSQSCTNTHSVSTMISFSVHGASVNDYIGATTYLDIIKGAATAFSQSTDYEVGVQYFGGTNGNGASFATLRNLATSTTPGADVATAIDGMSVTYANHYANVVSSAITNANSALQGESGRQKYHIIFSATIPLADFKGINTKPSDLDDICGVARTSKEYGIQTYVVLIGTLGENVFPSFYECVVEDPSTDAGIVIFNPASTNYSPITNLLCKNEPNGYDFKITEVNPIASTYFAPFVEVRNFGADASITVCLDGNCASAASVTTDSYLVVSSDGSVTGDATQTLGGGASAAGSWTASASAGSVTDSVSYTAGTNYAQDPITERSFELRNIGYNNDYPANWRLGCYNVWATPGSEPEIECAEVTTTDVGGGSCGQTQTDYSGCNSNSAPAPAAGTQCFTTGAYCNCGSGYLEDGDTCVLTVPPLEASICGVYVSKFWDDVSYAFYSFPKVLYDGDVTYKVTYPDGAGTTESESTTLSGYGATGFTNTLGSTFSITVEATYYAQIGTTAISSSASASCGTAITLDPSPSPTMEPTGVPSGVPSKTPTSSPTFDAPGVFIRTGGLARGDCGGGEDRSCCSPFGPQYGTTNTDGTLPGYGLTGISECEWDNKILYQIEKSEGNFVEREFLFQLYPDGYAAATTITAAIYSYGLINNTDWANLTFTGSFRYDGLIPPIITNANALEWGPDVSSLLSRRRLQDTTNSSYEYGNSLNMEIRPPGTAPYWVGLVDIEDGDSQGSLTLNISLADLKCNDGDIGCATFDSCSSTSFAYALIAVNCDIPSLTSGECKPLYPSILFFSVRRSSGLCEVLFGGGNQEDELPDWFWWVLIALIVFLLILAWLIYRFWWKQKKTAAELGDAEDELDQQIADNEAGFGKELDVGDVAFNPMATGVPGMNRPADAFGNELHQRQLEQQNDMVDVQAEIFQVRQDYGQVNTGNRHHNTGMQ